MILFSPPALNVAPLSSIPLFPSTDEPRVTSSTCTDIEAATSTDEPGVASSSCSDLVAATSSDYSPSVWNVSHVPTKEPVKPDAELSRRFNQFLRSRTTRFIAFSDGHGPMRVEDFSQILDMEEDWTSRVRVSFILFYIILFYITVSPFHHP